MQFEDFFGKNAFPVLSLETVRDLNRLALDTTEKLVDFQLDKARTYTSLGFTELRAALQVKDLGSLQNYLAGRSETARQLGEQLQNDVKTLAEIGSHYSRETQKLVRPQTGKKAA